MNEDDPFVDRCAIASERCRLPVANVFPPHIRDALVYAAGVGKPGSFERTQAIEDAIAIIQHRNPELFS